MWPGCRAGQSGSSVADGLHQGFGEEGLDGLPGGEALAQVGAQAAQGFDTGDDAGLFGKWRKRDDSSSQVSNVHVFCTDAFVQFQKHL